MWIYMKMLLGAESYDSTVTLRVVRSICSKRLFVATGPWTTAKTLLSPSENSADPSALLITPSFTEIGRNLLEGRLSFQQFPLQCRLKQPSPWLQSILWLQIPFKICINPYYGTPVNSLNTITVITLYEKSKKTSPLLKIPSKLPKKWTNF